MYGSTFIGSYRCVNIFSYIVNIFILSLDNKGSDKNNLIMQKFPLCKKKKKNI